MTYKNRPRKYKSYEHLLMHRFVVAVTVQVKCYRTLEMPARKLFSPFSPKPFFEVEAVKRILKFKANFDTLT